jgi:hypothetical protein
MTPDEFRRGLELYIQDNPGGLHVLIPPGSGICRIANVAWHNWIPGFISSRPGRWTRGRQSRRYFADDVRVCAAELGYFDTPVTPNVVVELWETSRNLPAVSVYQLPQALQDALYEDRGEPAVKWVKPHILIDVLRHTPEYADTNIIQAPSASGIVCDIGGTCLITPNSDAVRFIDRQRLGDWNLDL